MRFFETPGHTLESISAVVTDLERGPEPFAVFTGDTLFIGDVGRPDLSGDLTPQELAGMLNTSLHDKLLTLPDSVLVYPAHGAGSLCGRQLSSDSSSTIGREKQTNYALRAASKEEFVRLLTSELPERPEYFARDVEINRGGAAALEELAELPALDVWQTMKAREEGAVVLDTRPAAQFGSGHIPGALHIGLAGQFASWAGTLIGLDTPIVLVAEEQEGVEQARTRLARVGIERVSGWLADGMAAWTREEQPVEQVGQLPATELDQWMREGGRTPQVIDVRRPGEFEQGHVPGARLKPLAQLKKSLEDLDRDRPVVVNCKSGYRSSIATSILQREGFREVMNLIGGFDAWKTCGLPCAVHGDGERKSAGV
jgi:hydroxyacylglutathione hydrolase